MIYNVLNTSAESDYKGCGQAWAAIKEGTPVALRYMNDFRFDITALPAWVQAARKAYPYLDEPHFKVNTISPNTLSKIKKAAIDGGHPATGPRGGRIKASSIARSANRLLLDEEQRQFGEYRKACREQLALLGEEVVSGVCSCREFIQKPYI